MHVAEKLSMGSSEGGGESWRVEVRSPVPVPTVQALAVLVLGDGRGKYI